MLKIPLDATGWKRVVIKGKKKTEVLSVSAIHPQFLVSNRTTSVFRLADFALHQHKNAEAEFHCSEQRQR